MPCLWLLPKICLVNRVRQVAAEAAIKQWAAVKTTAHAAQVAATK